IATPGGRLSIDAPSAFWDFLENATIRANAGNLTDEKYINTLYQIGYYGAPRHWSLSLEYRF
ncbi:MAG TPA: hypothetical protein VET30_10060, partial [Pseudoxanthomonas sp.]|nr:hypothetical protein [Pseudoxanthomonas sp.]